MHAAELPAACENCRTTLHGAYCHACGQHAANPLRSFHHAVEDVFESFWHLDGRVFRTLRELFVPGRVACHYLDGQRARYVPPLRLFVVLTVLTFFIGQLAVGLGGRERPDEAQTRAAPTAAASAGVKTQFPQFDAARSVADVQRVLAEELADLRAARETVAYVPGGRQGFDVIEQQLRATARERIEALGGDTAQADALVARAAAPRLATADAPSSPASANRAIDAGNDTATKPVAGNTGRSDVSAFARALTGGQLQNPDRPWHEHDNPLAVGWLPAFANQWLNRRLANAERNVARIDESGGLAMASLALASVPSALFVLVPVFALLLRLIYVGSARGYLEHLVVALYSHAFMLIVLLAGFLLAIANALLPGTAVDQTIDVLHGALWLSVPAYLLVMQKRVYQQRWLVTAGKYLLLGGAYFMLVLAAVIYTMFAGLTSGG
ncbi:DUF3667 domain-containing protein [Cognatilysobacter bugurensis]|uniref:DUF3667 domain-containing protein n=1 Tax=Cognatilysobacter bugurensis TaxID=543356 RepID=A0A918T2M5_9GAMM|nr:DUF3667 domain-containing protein [Lysobacter bugurensis]GHA82513.1 hypothetical protein GCM10007067_20610 [Lysobacter bugurensis]